MILQRPSVLLASILFFFSLIITWRRLNSDAVVDCPVPPESYSGSSVGENKQEAGFLNAVGSEPTKVASNYTRNIFDFRKFAAKGENYGNENDLSPEDRELLRSLKTPTPRQDKLRKLYSLNGAQDWNKYIEELDDEALPPLTKFTQRYIFDHQHPQTCHNKKFVVMRHFADKNGLGTVINGAGHILNLAIRNGRILIWDYTRAPGRNFFEEACGGGGRGRSLDCIYERITSCEPHHVRKDNSIIVNAYWGPPKSLPGHAGSVPQIFGQAMKRILPDIKPDALKYWWRVQASGYIMRMNGPAMRRMREMRLNQTMQHGFTVDKKFGEVKNVPVPFPLPPSTFSMHVRHGDKGVEMELIPFTKYVSTAELHSAMNPLTSAKRAFISTEDVKVIDQAKLIRTLNDRPSTSNENWVWYHSDIPRINGGPEEQLRAFGNRTEMAIKWMQQLFMAIECDTIVGTRGSGWNRLIDHLRCAWVDCRKPFLEVGPESDWVYYNY